MTRTPTRWWSRSRLSRSQTATPDAAIGSSARSSVCCAACSPGVPIVSCRPGRDVISSQAMIARSPAPVSTAGLAEAPTRFAFFGRVSTNDVQDPSLSIPRQLGACENAIGPAGGEIAAYYWDIEPGRKDLAQRGHGADPASFKVPVPRRDADRARPGAARRAPVRRRRADGLQRDRDPDPAGQAGRRGVVRARPDREEPPRDGGVSPPGLAHRRPRPLRLRPGSAPAPQPAQGARGQTQAQAHHRPRPARRSC